LSAGTNWLDGITNATVIQSAVDSLYPGGGTVTIPAGTWYVSQPYPNDENDAPKNSAISIMGNNIEIGSADPSNLATLIANNRATTIFCLGEDLHGHAVQYTNFTLRDLTLEAQPHSVAIPDPPSGYTNFFELGQLALGSSQSQGSIAVFYGGPSASQINYNICISNCVFLHGVKSVVTSIGPYSAISNFMVRSCDFIPWDSTCFFSGTTNTGSAATSNTTSWQGGVVGIYGGAYNFVVLDNIYIGNSALTNMNTNNLEVVAPDGFVWFMTGGNNFVARNNISNYFLEAVQFNAGPTAVVGNTFATLCSDDSACALAAMGGPDPGATGNTLVNYATTFIGNSVTGGRHGERGIVCTLPFTLNFSGNSLTLYTPFDDSGDYPGAAVLVQTCQSACVCGNTLAAGGHGFCFVGTNSSALILNNNFSGATYRGIGNLNGNDQLNTAEIFGNILGQGATFHAQIPYNNSFGWFLKTNSYLGTCSNSVPAFLDPMSSAVHL
jgi:hypothetical protein